LCAVCTAIPFIILQGILVSIILYLFDMITINLIVVFFILLLSLSFWLVAWRLRSSNYLLLLYHK